MEREVTRTEEWVKSIQEMVPTITPSWAFDIAARLWPDQARRDIVKETTMRAGRNVEGIEGEVELPFGGTD